MNLKPDAKAAEVVNLNQTDSGFASEVIRRSGVNINLCWHCRSCVSGCPFVRAMDYPPNRVIRMVQFGLRKEALESSGIWICVGCNTCSISSSRITAPRRKSIARSKMLRSSRMLPV